MRRALIAQFDQYVKLNKKIPPEILTSLAGIEEPGRLADTVAAHLPLKLEQKQKVLEMFDVKQRLESLLAQLEAEIDILQVEKRIRGRVKRQMEKSQREYYLNEQVKAIQKELGEGEEGADLEEMEKRIKASRMPKDARHEGGERAEEAAPHVADVGRGDGGAQLPRDARQPAVEEEEQDLQGHPGGGEGAQRRPLRPREGQGAHPRVPRGAEPRRPHEGADPVPGRGAGRRQDLGRQVDRARDQPQVHPHVARRRARRGRDPRPPPDLHRLDAGQDPAEHDQGRREEPAVPARRGRQDGHGLPRRPVVGAAGGARSGAEPHLRRPLRRGRVRPVGGDVRRDREHAQHPAGAARPDGGDPALGLHRGREGQHRDPLPPAEAAQEQRRARPRSSRSPRARSATSSATSRAKPACATSSASCRRSAARR